MTEKGIFRSRAGRSRTIAALLIGGLCLGLVAIWTGGTHAELKGPSASDRQVALSVATLLQRQHLARRGLDDELSHRCLDSFLKTIDPMKLYFTQADVDDFSKFDDTIDDHITKGDIGPAYTIFRRLLTRIDERLKVVDELLDMEHDFTVDEQMVIERDLLKYPVDAVEARERWRKRIKYDLLVQKSEEVEGEEARKKLRRRYHSFARRMHQTDNDELLEMYLTALTTGYDPHTTYMSASTLENFEIQMRLELDGIGASLQSEDGYTTVHKIIPGGAADKNGQLKPGDKIVSVGQDKEGDMVDVVDMKLSDVVKLIRGRRGTIVRLGVAPAEQGKQQVISITRARIELKDSEARSEIFSAGQKSDGTPFQIGVVDLPSFYMDMSAARLGRADFKSTTRDVSRLLENFKQKNVDAVIVDLRRNGGGSLTEAIKLTGLFIDTGPVVQVKGFDGRVEPYDDRDAGSLWSGPLVVLTSQFSASASEIFAGAIQDYRRGLVIGDHNTHGKGTVQQLLDLGHQIFRLPNAPKLGALKITIQQFYRPSGDSTQNRGVLADVELPSLTTHLDVGESDLDFALEFDRVKPAPHDHYDFVDADLLVTLTKQSRERLAKSEEFAKVLKNIERYKEQKERKFVTLNEEKFLAERAELNAEREQRKKLEELNDPNRPVVKRDFYFNEAMAITLDYFNALRKQKVARTN